MPGKSTEKVTENWEWKDTRLDCVANQEEEALGNKEK